jgi:hypothetical protein
MSRQRALIRTALAVVLLAVISHTRSDPDLWGHVAFGRDIVSDGHIPTTDPYSFMSDRAWINHEWLAECAMYLAFAAGGGAGLVALKVSVVLAVLSLMWLELRRRQVEVGSRDLLLALAIVGTFPQANHVRPQVFSLLAFTLLIWVLARSNASRRWLYLIPLLFAAWVNLHGGWIVGGGVLAMWAVLTLPGSATRSEKGALFLVGGLALAGTLVNPYGWHMWLFLRETVGFGRAEITDWQPLYRLGPAYVALWLVLALAAVAGATRAWRSGEWELRRLVVVAALGLAAFQVGRLLAFFTIAIVLLLGRDIGAAIESWRGAGRREAARPHRVAAIVAMVIASTLILGGGVMTARSIACVRMGEGDPEPDVVAFVKEHQLQGRLAVWFDWGEYAIWHFAPDLLVSIDGRRETVYSDAVLQKHLAFYYGVSSRREFLDEVRPDHIWLQKNLPVVSSLIADGWVPVFSGPRSVWLSRAGTPATPAPGDIDTRCFPGP